VTVEVHAPVLVTGLPRSGTTWLAREIARSPGVALAGREPMNPRGRQFALGGTLTGWTRLQPAQATAQQRRTLRRVYRGREPRVYSRYGVRQWSAPLPRVRMVVKDPFALLSLPLVGEVTGATPVVLFRHPGALLKSYRRMGWRPAVSEMQELGLEVPGLQPPTGTDPHSVEVMAWFWTACYTTVLDDLRHVPQAVLVDHAELAKGGDPALSSLLTTLGIPCPDLKDGRGRSAPARLGIGRRHGEKPELHNFERTAAEVADGWRASLSPQEAETLELLTYRTWSALQSRRVRLNGQEAGSNMPGRTTDE
jgi:hypothetical protein